MADTRVRVILTAVDQGMTKGLNAAKSAVRSTANATKSVAGGMRTAKSAMTSAGNSAKTAAMHFKSVQKAVTRVKAAANGVRSIGSSFSSAFSTIKNSSNKLNAVKAVFTGLKASAAETAGSIKTKFSGAFSSIGAKAKSAFGQIAIGGLRQLGASAFMYLGQGIKSMVSEVSGVNKTWNNFRQTMKLTHGATAEWNGQLMSTAKYTKKAEAAMKSYAARTIYSSAEMSQTFAQLDSVGTKGTASLVRGFGNMAAMAENPKQAMKSISQQATQMAAKPKVAWQDFKIMLEQAPAGVAQVAKKMGMSTKELVAAVQNGQVKTEDFFKAMRKVGNDKSLTAHAAQYKDLGEAIEGAKDTLALRLTPAFNVFQKSALNGLNSIIGKLAGIDGNKLAKGFENGLNTAKRAWGSFKSGLDAAGITGSFNMIKSAVRQVADSFSGLAKSKSGMDICRVAGLALGAALRLVAIAAKMFATAFSFAASAINVVVSLIHKLVNAAQKVAGAFRRAKAAVQDFFNVKTKDDLTGKMDKLSSKAGSTKSAKVSVSADSSGAAAAGRKQGASYKAGLQQGLAGSNVIALNAANGTANSLGVGIGIAGANGRATGNGFKTGVGMARGAIGIGSSAAFGTGSALGAGKGLASANGQATGFGFASGVGTARQGIGTASAAASAAARAMNKSGAAHGAGVSVGSGFAAGISAMFGRVVAAASRLASAAISKLNSVIKKGSPSKVTTISGKSFGEGFIVGMKGTQKAVRRAAMNLVTIPQLQAPVIAMPQLATAGGYSTGAVSSNRNTAGDSGLFVTTVIELDGKVVAKKTAKYMKSEINDLNKKADRRKGVR